MRFICSLWMRKLNVCVMWLKCVISLSMRVACLCLYCKITKCTLSGDVASLHHRKIFHIHFYLQHKPLNNFCSHKNIFSFFNFATPMHFLCAPLLVMKICICSACSSVMTNTWNNICICFGTEHSWGYISDCIVCAIYPNSTSFLSHSINAFCKYLRMYVCSERETELRSDC